MKTRNFLGYLVLILLIACSNKTTQPTQPTKSTQPKPQPEKRSIVDPNDEKLMVKRDFSDELINQLKGTKTIFFYNKSNAQSIDSIKSAIKNSWDLTEIQFEDIANFDRFASNPSFSYFIIEGNSFTSSSQVTSYSSTHYYLALRLFKDVSKKGYIRTNGLCRIELFPNSETLAIASSSYNPAKIVNTLYTKGLFYNWSPVLLKAQLLNVSTNLKNLTRPWLYKYYRATDLTETLSNDTLYVPASLLVEFNPRSGKEKPQTENVFANYKYNYRVCSDSELFEIFETEKRGRLLFEYVKSSSDKFISIYDLRNKVVIYKKYTGTSYNLKAKDVDYIK